MPPPVNLPPGKGISDVVSPTKVLPQGDCGCAIEILPVDRHKDIRVICVSENDPDTYLQTVQRKVACRVTCVHGWDGVVRLLENLAGTSPRPTYDKLDLIDHSVDADQDGGGVLALGAWLIGAHPADHQGFAAAAAGPLKDLGIKRIRLIGCTTARGDGVTHAAALKAALQAHVPQIEVDGVTTVVMANHFGCDGFDNPQKAVKPISTWNTPVVKSLAALSTSGPSMRVRLRLPWMERELRELGVETFGHRLEIEDLQTTSEIIPSSKWPTLRPKPESPDRFMKQVLKTVHRRSGWLLPGLLRRPTGDLWLQSSRGFHRFEVLFAGQAVRVARTSGHSVVYAVRDPLRLRRLVGLSVTPLRWWHPCDLLRAIAYWLVSRWP